MRLPIRLLIPVLAGLACVSLAGPAAAGARITLDCEDATLHDVLQKLNRITGYVIVGQDGEGTSRYKPVATAKRLSLRWEEAPLGHVLREIAGRYGMTVGARSETIYAFHPNRSREPELSMTAAAKGELSLGVTFMEQAEVFRLVPGRDAIKPERTLTFGLTCRTRSGDADALGSLTSLTLVHLDGTRQQVISAPYEGRIGLPDELSFSPIAIPGGLKDATPQRLRSIEGAITQFEGIQERRFTQAVPKRDAASTDLTPFWTDSRGPLRFSVSRYAQQGRMLELHIRVESTPDAKEVLHDARPLRIGVRQEGDRVTWLYVSPSRVAAAEGGKIAVEFSCRGYVVSKPTSLDLAITTRAPGSKVVPFALDPVTLPFGKPFSARTTPLNLKLPVTVRDPLALNAPVAFRQDPGGSLKVRLAASTAGVASDSLELAVGLSRQTTAMAWSPIHWVHLPPPNPDTDPDPDYPIVRGLAPGTYRVTLRASRKAGGATVRVAVDGKPRVVRITAGEAATLTVPVSTP